MDTARGKIDYSKTVNLPKTDFPMKANLPQREPEMLRFWESLDLYRRIQEKGRNGEWYLLHDGPPYANGHIHMGTSLNKVLKDFVVKYKSMRGYRAPFVPGWDCHGLPVEHALFKELKKTKHDVEIVSFRRQARAFAMKWVDVQREEFKRLGVFGDWDRPYLTMDPAYEAEEVRGFGKLYVEGYVYKGLRPIHWCCECETALAEAEVEYQDKTSPTIYVKFAADDGLNRVFGVQGAAMLIWTTTPWTLPANLAIAVKEDFDYSAIRADGQILIVATGTIDRLRTELGWSNVDTIKTVKGKSLEGHACRHPFVQRDSKVILGEFVTLDVGTGLVHTAPGHGFEDYIMGNRYGLEVYSPVDEKGMFRRDVEHFGGMKVWAANPKIVERLDRDGNLVRHSALTHSYPHCWRCKNPVIYRATTQWFLRVDHNDLRRRTLDHITRVQWVPPHGENRITAMVSQRPDWCLSRQRLWGVPIPVFYCEACGEHYCTQESIRRVAAQSEDHGVDVWYEKPAADLLPPGASCSRCGGTAFRKETDILDVWFDSGTSHQSVLARRDDQKYPAELYLEGSDQHRGWFQTSLLTAVSLVGEPPYRAVVTHGWTLDEKGEKESKSKGNIIPPQEVMTKYGADVLRLWVSSVDYFSDVMIGPQIFEQMADTYKKIRNTIRFLIGNLSDFDSARDAVPYERLREIDRWALARCQSVLDEVTAAYDRFEFFRVYRSLYTFCVVDLSAFYLDVLKDRLYTAAADDPARRSAQTALREIAGVLARLMAPILPFTAEEVWRHLHDAGTQRSVHLESWPEGSPRWRDAVLESKWTRLLRIRDEASRRLESLRAAKVIGSSLEAEVTLETWDPAMGAFLTGFEETLETVFIVSEVHVHRTQESEVSGSPMIGEPVAVSARRTSGHKCQRCWKYTRTLATSREHPGLCEACLRVVNTLAGR